MRKDEFNDYNIKNPDGIDGAKYNDGKVVYQNDTSNFVKEHSANDVSEEFKVKETFDAKEEKVESFKQSTSTQSTSSVSNVSSASTSVSSASSAISSAATSIGSSLGALAGVVASTVATVVIVVAVFISTMTMNLSLVMANTDSLTIQLDIAGAQEEDFSEEIIATIEGEDGEYQEQLVNKDTLYLTFDNLKPGKEYFVCVKSKDKVFVEKSFFTSTVDVDRGQVLTHYDENKVVVSAMNVALEANEFYTITAKDAQGNIVFTQDSKNPNEEFVFMVESQTKLFFSLTVNGATYSISELDPNQSKYDLDNPIWEWQNGTIAAKVTFEALDGGEALVVDATVNKTEEVAATCETNGYILYTATATIEGKEFQTTATKQIQALGHDYVFDMFVWNDAYEAKAVYKCTHDETHLEYFDAEMSEEIVTPSNCIEGGSKMHYAVYDGHSTHRMEMLERSDHVYGELQVETPATCTSDGMAAHYHCDYCGAYFDEDKVETTLDDLKIEATGHNPEYKSGGFDGKTEMNLDPHYYCEACGQYFDEDMHEVNSYEIGYPSLSYSNSTQRISIYADGYMRSGGEFVPFVSSSEKKYYITGSHTSADQSLTIYSKNHDGSAPTGKVTIYMTFEDLTITARSWASAAYVIANSELEINIENIGTTRISGYNHPAFACADSTSAVTFKVTSTNGFTGFGFGRQDGNSPKLYNGTVTFYMNGTSVDQNGN